MPDDALGRTDSVTQPPKPAMPTGRRVVIALAVVLILFLAWEGLTTVVAYTDDAYVRSNLIAFAPQVTGHVIAVHVRDNQTVRKGDRLISIDGMDHRYLRDRDALKLRTPNLRKLADSGAWVDGLIGIAQRPQEIAPDRAPIAFEQHGPRLPARFLRPLMGLAHQRPERLHSAQTIGFFLRHY